MSWSLRRWLVGAAAAVGYAALIAVPTDLVDTPWFWREIPPTWWAWPGLIVTSVLAGMLTATYVAAPDVGEDDAVTRRSLAGGALTFFAVGCPVCNKLVLLALGTSGALTWFEPLQPALQLLAVGLLAWALRTRLRNQRSCALGASADRAETLSGTTRGAGDR